MLLYCLFVVVLLCVLFEPFKAVVLCRVVYRDNSKVNRCGVSVVLLWGYQQGVDNFVSVDNFVDKVWIGGK